MMIPLAIILNLAWYWSYLLLSTNCAIFISSFLPEHHLLQLYTASGAAGEEDHRAWVLLLLHPRQDGPGAQEQGVPRLQGGTLPQPRLLRSFHPRHRYPGACLASIGRCINYEAGGNKKPKKFKTVWHGIRGILKLSGRVNQVSLKLSAGFSNTVCWTS